MAKHANPFVPALGFDVLTPLYDTAIALTMRERAFKRDLIGMAQPGAGHRVLDLGCGTGTLAILLKATVPDADIVGLDLDPRILGIALAKAERAGVAVEWVEGSVVAPPFAEQSFDRILSSLVFHHLTDEEKEQALAAARRLLRPGGSLHIADFGKPHNRYTRFAAALFRHFDGAERTAANLEGVIPDLLRQAGFAAVHESAPRTTALGTLTIVSGAAD
jgi:ubiquinone/menaquinone biosynthesis C-methylase UbiE